MAERFPIVEAFGHPWDSKTSQAVEAAQSRYCPYSKKECEKYRQYKFGYCSVTYAAADDSGQPHTYAVCDHRLDGPPLDFVVRDHFKDRKTTLVPEIVLTNPRTSFDYVAFAQDDVEDIIGVETQAIDIRGGGVGPAWRAWEDGNVGDWRSYFTREALAKGRKDNVAYGVNMANIYKRLGLQVAVKGSYLHGIGVPFYVLMQNRPFEYLRRRIQFPAATGAKWDITFITFDYTGCKCADGTLEFAHAQTVRTTVAQYVGAMSSDTRLAKSAREDFLNRVKSKASLK